MKLKFVKQDGKKINEAYNFGERTLEGCAQSCSERGGTEQERG